MPTRSKTKKRALPSPALPVAVAPVAASVASAHADRCNGNGTGKAER
jgi:hypothetical protein